MFHGVVACNELVPVHAVVKKALASSVAEGERSEVDVAVGVSPDQIEAVAGGAAAIAFLEPIPWQQVLAWQVNSSTKRVGTSKNPLTKA